MNMGMLKQMLGLEGGSQTGTSQTTKNVTESGSTTNQLNPAIAQLLGTSGNGGILSGLTGAMSSGSSLPGIGNSFVNSNGQQILNNGYAGSNVLQSSQYNSPTIQGAQIQAPSQNNIDLTGTFGSLLSGGNNTALRDALQYGTDLTGAQFQKNQTDLTNNLMRNVLPSIRSNSVLAGQYGGSRQGIAEGNALGDYTNQLTNANTQMGLANSANTTGQLANDYQLGQNRALSAVQGLSAQQYGTAQQDAAARQGADNTNVSALLATRGQNSSNLATGMGLQQGLLGTAANYGNADLTRLGTTAGILAPFLNAGSTTTTNGTTNTVGTTPIYENHGAGLLSSLSSLASMFG
jgi:hypothetical protein